MHRMYGIFTYISYKFTLQGTNISPKNGILKMIFLFPRWDMLVPWRVSQMQIDIPYIRRIWEWCCLYIFATWMHKKTLKIYRVYDDLIDLIWYQYIYGTTCYLKTNI